MLAFLTRRLIFAFALPVVLFGGVLISSYMKFHYLTTPLLAPDLVYFVNRDLLEVAMRYPPIMIAIISAACWSSARSRCHSCCSSARD